MTVAIIILVLAFSTILSLIEIPKLLQNKLYKELAAFSVLLAAGTILAILKSLNVQITNPSDWIAWVYSPASDLIKNILE